MQIIGCLIKYPLYLSEPSVSIITDDFDNRFQKLIFGAINNLYQEGVTKISSIDIDNYLSKYDTAYLNYKEENGIQFLQDAEELAQVNNFHYYYKRFKKLSALKALKKAGLNISFIYDENISDPKKAQEMELKFEESSLEDIFRQVLYKFTGIQKTFVTKGADRSVFAHEGLKELIGNFKISPEIGFPLPAKIFNTITRGARKGKFYLTSGVTGSGKTRQMVGEACYLAYPLRYNIINKKWINEGNNQKVLFITTEMGFDEIQTLIVAHLADVNEDKIITGKYDGNEEERVMQAIQIIEHYGNNFRIEHLPDPSITEIQTLIRFNRQEYSTDHVFYDYIFSSPGLLNEYRDLRIREDVILGMLSTMLKDIAVELGIFLKSGTQMNREWEQRKKGIRNQNMIRGSTSIADKVDVGSICLPITEEELVMLGPALQKLEMPTPTHVTDIYKARRSLHNHVRVWSKVDLGTCRVEDLFLTDTNFNPINIAISEYITINKFSFNEGTGEVKKIIENNNFIFNKDKEIKKEIKIEEVKKEETKLSDLI